MCIRDRPSLAAGIYSRREWGLFVVIRISPLYNTKLIFKPQFQVKTPWTTPCTSLEAGILFFGVLSAFGGGTESAPRSSHLIWIWCGSDVDLMCIWCGSDVHLMWIWCASDVDLMWIWCGAKHNKNNEKNMKNQWNTIFEECIARRHPSNHSTPPVEPFDAACRTIRHGLSKR